MVQEYCENIHSDLTAIYDCIEAVILRTASDQMNVIPFTKTAISVHVGQVLLSLSHLHYRYQENSLVQTDCHHPPPMESNCRHTRTVRNFQHNWLL